MKRCRLGTWDPHVHYLDDLYWARVWRSMHDRADEIGAELVDLPSPDDPSDDAAYDDVIARTRSAGVNVVLDWPFVEEHAVALLDAGIGIVHLSETELEHPRLAAPEGLEGVAFDLMQRAIEATSHEGTILTAGGGMQLGSSDDGASRLRGSMRAAVAHGAVRQIHVPTFWDDRSVDQVARHLRGSNIVVDAVVGFSDRVAACAREASVRLGIATIDVPTFGINGTPDAIAAILSGHLTGTAMGSAEEVGRRAVDVAVAMAGKTRYPRRFPYRFRYVDAESAQTVAASMLVDFGSALRTPRTLASSDRRTQNRGLRTTEAIREAFVQARSSSAALADALLVVRRSFALDRGIAVWLDPSPKGGTEPGRWYRMDERGTVEVVAVPDRAWEEVTTVPTTSTQERCDAEGRRWSVTYLPLATAGSCFGCIEWWHEVGGVPSMAMLDELSFVARQIAASMDLVGRPRGTTFDGDVREASRDVVVWIESAVDGRGVVEAVVASGASIEVRHLPSSHRASWEWATSLAEDRRGRGEVVTIAVLARWTPEAHEWISSWEPNDRSTSFLIVSEQPWPAQAIRSLPDDAPAVVHSTLTLPPSDVERFVVRRLHAKVPRTHGRRVAEARSLVASIHAAYEEADGHEAIGADDEDRRYDRSADADVRRAFRAVMGVSPRTYTVRYRVHRSMRWLRNTDLSITEIGTRLGWSDPAQFSNAFRKVAGVSPRRYRSSSRLG